MVILFDQYNMPESIFEIIFATKQQVIVAKLLLEQMKEKDGEIGKTEMSMFATALSRILLPPIPAKSLR